MKLSIIVPVYNSAEILRELNDRIYKSVNEMNLINTFEFIMINDSSDDKSWEVIKSLSKENNYIKGISFIAIKINHNLRVRYF